MWSVGKEFDSFFGKEERRWMDGVMRLEEFIGIKAKF